MAHRFFSRNYLYPMTTNRIAELRRDYAKASLDEKEILQDPLAFFGLWMQEAIQAEVPEPNAMNFVSVSPEGFPSARMVLLKGFSPEGFSFYTNQDSRKGREIALNPKVALVFWWPELERQIRIEGLAELISEAEATAYFQSRPRESQIGAWASAQSEVLSSRAELEARFAAESLRFAAQSLIPKPPFWGGYLIRPQRMEFWQGRPSRLHDRILFTRLDEQNWKIERLSP